MRRRAVVRTLRVLWSVLLQRVRMDCCLLWQILVVTLVVVWNFRRGFRDVVVGLVAVIFGRLASSIVDVVIIDVVARCKVVTYLLPFVWGGC